MRLTFVALLVVASACTPPADTDAPHDTDVPHDTDSVPDTDRGTDTELPAETDVVDTDTDTDTDSPVDTDPPVDTDTDPPTDTHTDTDTDIVCRGDLDQIGDVYGPPVRADVETLDDLDAWLCLVDPDRAATCPPAHEPCEAAPGQALTAVFVQASAYVSQYALYDDAGQIVAYTVKSDTNEFCGHHSRLWLGDIPYVGTCRIIVVRGINPSPCGPPLLCTSTP